MMNKPEEVLKALSDETRLRIINLLYERELCVCDVMEVLQISQAKASRHLIYLKNSGLARDRKVAQWAYYSLAKDDSLKFIDKPIVFKNSGDKLDTMKAANQKIDTPPKKISEIKIDNSKIDKRIVESKSLSGQQIKSQCKNVAEVKSDPGMSNIFR